MNDSSEAVTHSPLSAKMETRDVNVFYGDAQAIKDVTLDITDRSVTALIGPSGCGKSTYLRALNRMNDTIDGCRVEGRILLDGEDIYGRGVDPVEVEDVLFGAANQTLEQGFNVARIIALTAGLAGTDVEPAAELTPRFRRVE